MSDDNWQDLQPSRVQPRDIPTVTMRLSLSGSDKASQTYIGINNKLVEALGWTVDGKSRVRIQRGDGPNAARLRISPDAKGLFRLQKSGSSAFGFNGARISLKIPGQPGQPIPQVVVTHKVVGDALILDLPAQWLVGAEKLSAHEKHMAEMLRGSTAEEGKAEKVLTAKPDTSFEQKVETQSIVETEAVAENNRRVDEIAKAILATNKPEPRVPTVPGIEEVEAHEKTAPPPAEKPKDHGIVVKGRFFTINGDAASTFGLMSDEVALFKALLERFGELMPNAGLKRIENSFLSILLRLYKRMNGSKIMLVQKTNGWLLTWSDDPKYRAF